VRLPVVTRRVIPSARTAEAAGVPAQQIRGDARFVDEDILPRVVERPHLGDRLLVC
jgi:hypothetical protein